MNLKATVKSRRLLSNGWSLSRYRPLTAALSFPEPTQSVGIRRPRDPGGRRPRLGPSLSPQHGNQDSSLPVCEHKGQTGPDGHSPPMKYTVGNPVRAISFMANRLLDGWSAGKEGGGDFSHCLRPQGERSLVSDLFSGPESCFETKHAYLHCPLNYSQCASMTCVTRTQA
jgi:hypothetical protein